MKITKSIKKTVLKSINVSSANSAEKSANTACLVWQYQPKATDKVRKLRKF